MNLFQIIICVICAIVVGFYVAAIVVELIQFLVRHYPDPRHKSELHARDRYEVADQIADDWNEIANKLNQNK